MSIANHNGTTTNFSAALALATIGWHVFPVYERLASGKCACGKQDCTRSAKHPRTIDGFKSATIDREKIENWWRRWPSANIGVATGAVSNIFVLDIDPKSDGTASLAALISAHGEIPSTVEAITGGDGRHFFFQHPGANVQTKSMLRPGVDVRGDGGYVVVAPSTHISGGTYQWVTGKDPVTLTASISPKWILDLVTEKPKSRISTAQSMNAFPEGTRNSSLISVAGSLRAKGLGSSAILNTLLAVNENSCDPPLSRNEVESIVQSAARYPLAADRPLSWSEMKCLPDISLAAPLLRAEMIPKPFRKWIIDVSDRMQVLPDFIAPMAIVAASTVIGRQIAIRPKKQDSYTIIPNVWGALVALPSSLKTPAINEALSPLFRLEDLATAKYADDKSNAELESFCLESDIKNLEKQISRGKGDRDFLFHQIKELKDKQQRIIPKERRYIANDSTIEQLAVLLSENANGLLVQRDELMGFLNMMEKPGHENDRAFYLESWSGDGRYKVDRITRSSISVNGMRLSILGGIQPARIKNYIYEVTSDSAGNDGFIQRFQMLIYPDQKKSWELVDRKPQREAKAHVEFIFSELADLDLLDLNPLGDSNALPYLRFSDEAQEVYYQWITKLENRLLQQNFDPPALQTHLGKYRSLMPTLALIFFLISYVESKFLGNQVPKWAANQAVQWCEYLEAHAKKVYGLLGELQLDSAKAFMKKVVEGKIKDGESIRDIYRHHWSLLDSPKKVESAIALLSEHGWCQTQQVFTGGAPSEVIRLNPKWTENLKNRDARTANTDRQASSGGSGTSSPSQVH